MAGIHFRPISYLGQLFFPQLCVHCGAVEAASNSGLCVGCQYTIPLIDNAVRPSAVQQRLQQRFYCHNAVAHTLQVGQGVVASLIHALKYQGYRQIGRWCGRQLAADVVSFATQIDAIIPVPLHRTKLHSRGYNQAGLIADSLGAMFGIPVIHKAVYRAVKTDSQTQKSRRERLQNVADIFRIQDEPALSKRHLLLIDDVLTTGATLEALANTLQQLPGVHISVAAFAMASD